VDFAISPTVALAFTVLVAAVLVAPRYAAIELLLTVMFPAAPDVPDTRLRIDPDASVSTLAVMPTPDELIDAARPVSVLSDEFRVMVTAFPAASCRVIAPVKAVLVLATSAR